MDLRWGVLRICILAFILFIITLWADIQIDQGNFSIPAWLKIGNINDARVLLTAIIGAMGTVLALVISVILIILSMAANQFGPRLLRRFILIENGQTAIGLFCATFLFSLCTLVAAYEENGHAFVPQISCITCCLLMIIAFASLIQYIEAIRKGIQAGNLIASVDQDLHLALINFVKLRTQNAQTLTPEIAQEIKQLHQKTHHEGFEVAAITAGYLQSIDYLALLKTAIEKNVTIVFTIRPGQFVFLQTIIAYVIPAEQGPNLMVNINQAFEIGAHRTLKQDPEFAIAEIVEIGLRALSPAVNDTYTGLVCTDWLCNNLLSLVNLPIEHPCWQDKTGRVYLIEMPVTFADFVAAAFNMMRQAAASNPAILIRMLQNFTRMAHYITLDTERAAILTQVNAIQDEALKQPFAAYDQEQIAQHYTAAKQALMI